MEAQQTEGARLSQGRILRPPKNFITASGVRWAKLLDSRPTFIKRHRLTGARAQGIRYQTKVEAKLRQIWCGAESDAVLLVGPWIEFMDDTGRRWCQPDAVMMQGDGRAGIIYEIKYRHTADAWFQLWRLYTPVLEALFPACKWECMEVVRWMDPATSWPEVPTVTASLRSVPDSRRTGIHVWNPQRDFTL